MFRLLSLLLVTVSALISGCAMCSTPYDCQYGAYGGSNPRGDRVHGRVGSAFRDAAVSAAPGEFVEGQIIDGQVIDGQVIEGEIVQDGIMSGEVVQDGIMSGEVIQDGIIENNIDPNGSYDSSGVIESPIVELPSTEAEFVPAAPKMELPSNVNDAINNAISPNPGGVPAAPMDLPLGSPTPLPTADAPLPNLDRIFDGLPPERHEATIEVLPSVIESPIR